MFFPYGIYSKHRESLSRGQSAWNIQVLDILYHTPLKGVGPPFQVTRNPLPLTRKHHHSVFNVELDLAIGEVRMVHILTVEDIFVSIVPHDGSLAFLGGEGHKHELLPLDLSDSASHGEDIGHKPSRPIVGNMLDTIRVLDGTEKRVEVGMLASREVGEVGEVERGCHALYSNGLSGLSSVYFPGTRYSVSYTAQGGLGHFLSDP